MAYGTYLTTYLTSGNAVRTVAAELCLIAVCIIGDEAIKTATVPQWMRALQDSAVHGLVALLSWFIVIGCHMTSYTLYETILCGGLASIVDVDHFIAAGSFSLDAALSLSKRPMFHNSTLIPLLAVALYLALRVIRFIFPSPLLTSLSENLVLIFIVAWSTHHLRDATRRGLWFAPWGSTPALPRTLYLASLLIIPLLLRLLVHDKHSLQQHGGTKLIPDVSPV